MGRVKTRRFLFHLGFTSRRLGTASETVNSDNHQSRARFAAPGFMFRPFDPDTEKRLHAWPWRGPPPIAARSYRIGYFADMRSAGWAGALCVF